MDNSYIAGFFDCEGSAMILTIRRKLKRGVVYRFRPIIKIQQKTKAVLNVIMEHIGYGHIDRTPTGFTYVINGLEGIEKFCVEVKPYIFIKLDAIEAVEDLVDFQSSKKRKNEPYTLDDTTKMIELRDKAFRANGKTRSGLKQKYGWLDIVTKTHFVPAIDEWKENRMRGIRRLHNAQKQD